MSENYQVLARKYRPQTFQDVVGQEETVRILKNSIRLGRLAQAYIFSGSRGIGKTTLARLLAKAANCSGLTEDTEPCNKCPSCLEITGSCSLDVLEIDGASNRGIDDIRQINETIGYAPSSGNYKIYIIDEVHMLTKEAFNALLKTLEEPPPTIKFFFATTEPHKVPPTILSRCQRFDLARIGYEKIVAKLKLILQDLKREAEEKALHLIARFSDGSLRDSQSFLDQLLCYEDGVITEDAVSKILGLIPQDYFFQLDEAVKEGKEEFAYELTDSIYTAGKDLTHFTQELIEHFRRHCILKYEKGPLELSPQVQHKYQQNVSFYTKEELCHILELLLSELGKVQKSLSKKTAVEILLLQIIRCKKRISLPLLIQRLLELEKKLDGQAAAEKTAMQPPDSASSAPVEKPVSFSQAAPATPAEHQTAAAAQKEPEEPPAVDDASSAKEEKKKIADTTGPAQKELAAVPFSLQEPSSNTAEENTKKTNETAGGKLDTFLHFTAVELDGIAKKH